MKILGRLVPVAGIIVLALAGVFFAMGGIQIIRILAGPSLPVAAKPPTVMADLKYLRDAVLANDRGGKPEEYGQFAAILDRSKATSADEVTLAASEAMAAFHNGHSTVDGPLMHQLPVRLHWTSDALIIVKAKPAYANLLGDKIVTIGGVNPEQLLLKMRLLVGGGTPGWARYRSEYFLTAPVALRTLGAAVGRNGDVELEIGDATGQTTRVSLPTEKQILPADAFRQWRDQLPGDVHFKTQGWVTLLKPSPAAPLYQQEPANTYLIRDVPEHDALYVRMSGSVDDKHETAAAFVQRVQAALRKYRRRNTIVDFRFNFGGGYDLSLPVAKAVAQETRPDGDIYLIIGPNTFSAGLIAASQLKYYGGSRVTVVGQQLGDGLRFRAEGFPIVLPATGVEIYAPSAWDDVSADCGWFADCWPPQKFMLKGIGDLHPDIAAANTWASYRNGVDLIVNAVFSDIDRRKRH